MTRAEFANVLAKYWRGIGMKEGETLIGFANRTNDGMLEDYYGVAVADIATNGFDPEPEIIDRQVQMRVVEQLGEAAKRSRPFVGSHKLPHDTDWD